VGYMPNIVDVGYTYCDRFGVCNQCERSRRTGKVLVVAI